MNYALLSRSDEESGSIIANAGFTRKIGFLRADGTYALNAKHTATWGGLQSGGQAISFM